MKNEVITTLGSSSEEIVLQVLMQIIVILFFSKLVSRIASKFGGQTGVAGEILAGILLGPSLLSSIFPAFFSGLFTEQTSIAFVVLSQIGLVFLMFQIGMEFNFSKQLQSSKGLFILISMAGILFPFVLGYFAANYFWIQLPDPKPPLLAFKLFFAIAMSITAIPILGRIFIELNYSKTRVASLIISSAAIDDVIGWFLLGIITTLVTASFNLLSVIKSVVLLISFSALVIYFGKKHLSTYIQRELVKTENLNTNTLFTVIFCLLLSAIITSYIGIYAIFGGNGILVLGDLSIYSFCLYGIKN